MKLLRRAALTGLLGLLGFHPAPAYAAITRGPLLGAVTQHEITIRWFSDTPSIGTVKYGPFPGPSILGTSEAAARTDHEVRLTGLDPSTKYLYSLSSGSDTMSGPKLSFTTAPTVCQPYRFIVMGDTRGLTTYCDDFSAWKLVAGMMDTQGAQMMVGTGDYTYRGEDSGCWNKWFGSIGDLFKHTPFFPAIGNHDYQTQHYTDEKNVGLINFARWFSVPQGPEVGKITTYYTFDFGNTRFIVYDTFKDHQPGSPQLLWIESQLSVAKQDPNVQHVYVINHATFYGVGGFCWINEGNMQNNENWVQPLLAKYEVDGTFAGHEHSYQRAAKDGVQHVVTGGGGALLECPLPPCVTNAKYLVKYNACTFHAVIVDVQGAHVKYTALSVDGTTVIDSWQTDHWTYKHPNCGQTADGAAVRDAAPAIPDLRAADAPSRPDAARTDAAFGSDGVTQQPAPHGCACTVRQSSSPDLSVIAFGLLVGILVLARRRGQG